MSKKKGVYVYYIAPNSFTIESYCSKQPNALPENIEDI